MKSIKIMNVFRKQSLMAFVFFFSALHSLTSSAALKIGLVLDMGGKDDKSFNAAAFAGATRAQKELGIELKVLEAPDMNSFTSLQKSLVKKNYDLVIGVGFSQADAIKENAKAFPAQKFAIVDSEIQSPNVKSLLFEEHEGSFLMGVIAALKSKSNKFGFVGGMEIPLIKRFAMGYEAGLKHINKSAALSTSFVGVTGEAWNNPARAKEMALAQYGSGIEVIFAAAGASGAGVFDAAESTKKFAIGVDSNQNWIKPGLILTSMLKRVDVAVFDTIKELQQDKFTAGLTRFGLKNQGVDYALDQHNKSLLSKEMIARVDAIKAEIIKGQLQVPDFYKLKK